MPRAKYKRTGVTAKAREIMGKMTPEQLADINHVTQALQKARIKVDKSLIYQVRSTLREGQTTQAGESYSLRQLMAVNDAAKQVGGMENLKRIIRTIEKVRE